MRKPQVHWFSRFDQPQVDRLLIFDFGLGEVVGKFDGGHFFSTNDPGLWDRVLVNKWRYVENSVPAIRAA